MTGTHEPAGSPILENSRHHLTLLFFLALIKKFASFRQDFFLFVLLSARAADLIFYLLSIPRAFRSFYSDARLIQKRDSYALNNTFISQIGTYTLAVYRHLNSLHLPLIGLENRALYQLGATSHPTWITGHHFPSLLPESYLKPRLSKTGPASRPQTFFNASDCHLPLESTPLGEKTSISLGGFLRLSPLGYLGFNLTGLPRSFYS